MKYTKNISIVFFSILAVISATSAFPIYMCKSAELQIMLINIALNKLVDIITLFCSFLSLSIAEKPSPFDNFQRINPGNHPKRPSNIVKKTLKPNWLGDSINLITSETIPIMKP